MSNIGALLRYSPVSGVSTAASFTLNIGNKVESRPIWFHGKLYYAAREVTTLLSLRAKVQALSGRSIPATGTVTKLANLHATNHVAKIKTFLPFTGYLYYTGEESDDLSLNTGKGYGGLGYYDVTNHPAPRL